LLLEAFLRSPNRITTTEPLKPNKWIKYFFGGTLAVLLLYYWLKRGTNTTRNFEPETTPQKAVTKANRPELNDFILAQWKFETGNYKSSLFNRANNATGMRIASKRKQVRTGETNGYAVYKDLHQCAEDLGLWFDYVNFPQAKSLREYVEALKQKGYFTAPLEKYYNGVKYYYDASNK
jgi:hypothetical protein